jgi:hypothetical protein
MAVTALLLLLLLLLLLHALHFFLRAGHVCVPAPGPRVCELDAALAPRQPRQQVRPASRRATAGEVSRGAPGSSRHSSGDERRGAGQLAALLAFNHCDKQH